MNIQRSQLAKFLPDNEAIRIFEDVVRTAERADKNAGQITARVSDVSTDSTTLVSAGIALPVAANSIYRFEFFGAYTVASAAVGTRWVIDGPAASTLAYSSQWSLTSTTRTTTEASAYNLPAAANASSSSAGGNLVRIDGLIAPTANGELTLWFASGGASLVTLKAGSFGRLIRLT